MVMRPDDAAMIEACEATRDVLRIEELLQCKRLEVGAIEETLRFKNGEVEALEKSLACAREIHKMARENLRAILKVEEDAAGISVEDLEAAGISDLVRRVRERAQTDQPGAFDDLLATIEENAKTDPHTIDLIFKDLDTATDSPELLIAVLTATLRWKDYTPRRMRFIQEVANRLNAEVGEVRTNNILNGLR
jgi:hypothetical protein